MKKLLLWGITATLLVPCAPLIDWAYYRDREFFIPPIFYTSEIPIRKDAYGEGHFGAPRKRGGLHKGLDITAPLYTEVIASKGGLAIVRFQKNGMGKYVTIKHSGDYSTLYGHLAEYCIKDRERIRQGDIIGYVGKTGNADNKKIKSHLHFEIRKNKEYLDPLLYIK